MADVFVQNLFHRSAFFCFIAMRNSTYPSQHNGGKAYANESQYLCFFLWNHNVIVMKEHVKLTFSNESNMLKWNEHSWINNIDSRQLTFQKSTFSFSFRQWWILQKHVNAHHYKQDDIWQSQREFSWALR